jgi:hypothetical protein
MLLTHGTWNSRAGTAAREFALRYLGRRHSDVFRRLEWCLRDIGTVTPTDCTDTRRWRCRYWNCEQKPQRSSRDSARELKEFQPRVLEALNDHQLHPHQYSLSAHPFPDSRPLRTQFWEWLRHIGDDLFLHSSLWRDEACFTLQCVFNINKSRTGHGIVFMLSVNVGIVYASALALDWIRQ